MTSSITPAKSAPFGRVFTAIAVFVLLTFIAYYFFIAPPISPKPPLNVQGAGSGPIEETASGPTTTETPKNSASSSPASALKTKTVEEFIALLRATPLPGGRQQVFNIEPKSAEARSYHPLLAAYDVEDAHWLDEHYYPTALQVAAVMDGDESRFEERRLLESELAEIGAIAAHYFSKNDPRWERWAYKAMALGSPFGARLFLIDNVRIIHNRAPEKNNSYLYYNFLISAMGDLDDAIDVRSSYWDQSPKYTTGDIASAKSKAYGMLQTISANRARAGMGPLVIRLRPYGHNLPREYRQLTQNFFLQNPSSFYPKSK